MCIRDRMMNAEIVDDIRNVVMKAAEETLGRRWIGGTRKRHTRWWNEEVRGVVKEKTVKRRAKREAAKIVAEELREDVRGGRKKIFRLAKTYRGSKKKVASIKDEQGEVLIRPEDINKRWTEYFGKLLGEEGEEMEEQLEEVRPKEEAGVITREELDEA